MSLATRMARRRQSPTGTDPSRPDSSPSSPSLPAPSSEGITEAEAGARVEVESYFGPLDASASVTDRFLMTLDRMARPLLSQQPHHPLSQFFKVFGKRMGRDIRKVPEDVITGVTKEVVAEWARVVYADADYVLVPLRENPAGITDIRAINSAELLALAAPAEPSELLATAPDAADVP